MATCAVSCSTWANRDPRSDGGYGDGDGNFIFFFALLAAGWAAYSIFDSEQSGKARFEAAGLVLAGIGAAFAFGDGGFISCVFWIFGACMAWGILSALFGAKPTPKPFTRPELRTGQVGGTASQSEVQSIPVGAPETKKPTARECIAQPRSKDPAPAARAPLKPQPEHRRQPEVQQQRRPPDDPPALVKYEVASRRAPSEPVLDRKSAPTRPPTPFPAFKGSQSARPARLNEAFEREAQRQRQLQAMNTAAAQARARVRGFAIATLPGLPPVSEERIGYWIPLGGEVTSDAMHCERCDVAVRIISVGSNRLCCQCGAPRRI